MQRPQQRAQGAVLTAYVRRVEAVIPTTYSASSTRPSSDPIDTACLYSSRTLTRIVVIR